MPSEKIKIQKEAVVSTISERMTNAKSFVIVDYIGLTVEQDTILRNALRKAGVDYKVIKNTLAIKAATKIGIKGLENHLKGPTAIASSTTDLTTPAKLMCEYAKKFHPLEIKCGVVEGSIIDSEGVKTLAELPSREVLIAKVLGGFNAPISSFVNVLNANIRGLVVALNAIAEDKKGA